TRSVNFMNAICSGCCGCAQPNFLFARSLQVGCNQSGYAIPTQVRSQFVARRRMQPQCSDSVVIGVLLIAAEGERHQLSLPSGLYLMGRSKATQDIAWLHRLLCLIPDQCQEASPSLVRSCLRRPRVSFESGGAQPEVFLRQSIAADSNS